MLTLASLLAHTSTTQSATPAQEVNRQCFGLQIAVHFAVFMLHVSGFIVFELEVKFIFIYHLQRSVYVALSRRQMCGRESLHPDMESIFTVYLCSLVNGDLENVGVRAKHNSRTTAQSFGFCG
jgi:hypothetical protein